MAPTPPTPWPVRVYNYHFGSSQTFGQDPRYFPANVLGGICTTATPTAPCADPCQVVSLGKGGFIALEFDPPIADGPGSDFIVFENAFQYGGGQVFDEWMQVEVSQDGEHWVAIPFDSLTGAGLAGRTPTGCATCSGLINWQDPAQAGGDAFDLAQVGLEWARYVRVKDATHWQSPDRLSADLDGVVAIHQLSAASLRAEEPSFCWRVGSFLYIHSDFQPHVQMWDRAGRAVYTPLAQPLEPDRWQVELLPGCWVVQVQAGEKVWAGKLLE